MRAGRFAEDACPSACPLCDQLRRRHLPVGLCGACDHAGGVKADGRVYKLQPVAVSAPEGPGISTL